MILGIMLVSFFIIIFVGTCVVVVHSCKLQGHIKHEWEGYLGDVGLGRYPSMRHPTPS